MKYNTSEIMKKAWKNHRHGQDFSTALHRAWLSAKSRPLNDKKVEATKLLLGIEEECHTYSEWKEAGYEVIHGSKALFGVELIWQGKGEGKSYKARFFGKSQVRRIAV